MGDDRGDALMPYTLMKGLVWLLLAVLLGIVIGWLLRSVAAKRQLSRVRAQHVETAELERLRGRVANLEPVVAERDRLKAELDAARSEPHVGLAAAPAEDSTVPPADSPPADSPPAGAPPADEAVTASVAPDVIEAAGVLGHQITVDDLTVVEGIGPKIEELCHGIGIRTWFDLSTTEVSLLRTMLADAGSRFRSHDPATWPEQAGLLAAGRWQEFQALTNRLSGGRAVD
jgi:predicted flap endonuclease-1-like 5' DNA nuclease